jgi:hypothetical protein
MRSKDIKHLGVGLGIGSLTTAAVLGILFLIPGVRNNILSAPQNAQAQSLPPTSQPITSNLAIQLTTPEIAPTFTPEIHTPTPQPTEYFEIPATETLFVEPSPLPSPSPTSTTSNWDGLVTSGDIAIVGPLEQDQLLRLYEASLSFIAPTLAESKKMSVEINKLRFSDPSTTCGPLSIAILQKAGLLSMDLVPHDYFLINPDNGTDRILLEKAFPNTSHENKRYKIKLNKVNWLAQPLMPGDFLYIYSGEEGNFEHMLVVTRVDSLGRAYSVTNYNTEQGFIINEVMLYDPADPSAGIFAQWTKRKDQLLGSTGFAGYEVWRQIQ